MEPDYLLKIFERKALRLEIHIMSSIETEYLDRYCFERRCEMSLSLEWFLWPFRVMDVRQDL